MPTISVIVPVYKVEKYLRACIDSILAQTFTDFELILVDDGSPDNCGAICDEYARRLGGEIETIGNTESLARVPAGEPLMPHIRVFHKENGGVSSARNLGIERSRGEWIVFVDSDDWVESDKFSKFCEQIASVNERVDLVVGTMVGKKSPVKLGNVGINDFFLQGGFACLSVCLAGFRLKIVNDYQLRFPVGIKYAEDRSWVLKYLFFAGTILNTGIDFYNYRQVETSSMNTIDENLAKFTRDHIWVVEDLLSFRERHQDVSPFVAGEIFGFVLPWFYKIYKLDKEEQSMVQSWIRKTAFPREDFKFVSFPRKLLWFLAKISIVFPEIYYGVKGR